MTPNENVTKLRGNRFAGMMYVVLSMMFLSCDKVETLNVIHIDYESIGVYGGSISSRPESDSAKLFWQRELDIPVITYGVDGAGFTRNTAQPNIPLQIDRSPKLSTMVLWCSTNDFNSPVENEDKYSPDTQNGGMRIAIEKIIAKDPNCTILGFCSLPGYLDSNPSWGASQVEGQIKVFDEYGIPYLNQYNYFTVDDIPRMYQPDKLHFTAQGYIAIRERQLEFIKQYITN